MKTFSGALLAALDAGEVITVGAVKIATSTPFRVWSGYETLTLASEAYTGIGHAGLVSVSGGRIGGSEQGLDLTLSGVDPDVVGLLDQTDIIRAPVVVWRLMFDISGVNLLGAHVYARGRVDGLPVEETPGGTATIRCRVETAARGLGRTTGRTASDADQRMIDALDGSHRWLTIAPVRTLAWGGKPPARAAETLPQAGYMAGAVPIGPFF